MKISNVYAVDYNPVGPADLVDHPGFGNSFDFADSVMTSAASAGLSADSSAASVDLAGSSGSTAAGFDQ